MRFADLMKGPDTKFRAYASYTTHITMRQVGWLIGGGPRDGEFLPWGHDLKIREAHGSFYPVYMEIGD